jgi:aspartate aminotransferase-like enzyme
MIPGPTAVPPTVLLEMARPMFNHRGPQFADLLVRVTAGLKAAFATQSEVFVLTCSGTGAMEAAVVNVLSPGDIVLSLPYGMFGKRFATIARTYGADVEEIETPWGRVPRGELLRERLAKDVEGNIKAVLLTHNETSTGAQANIEELARARGNHPALLLVDSVSGLGAAPLRMDEWGLDVVVAASQKAFAAPPGLGFVAMSAKALKAMETAKMPRFYLDLRMARQFHAKGQTPFTPAISQIRTMAAALDMMEQEGLEQVIARHAKVARFCRETAQRMGFRLYAEPAGASNTVTTLCVPPGLDSRKLRQRMLDDYGVVVSGGQAHLENDLIRIGHLGAVTTIDIASTLEAMRLVLVGMGVEVPLQHKEASLASHVTSSL